MWAALSNWLWRIGSKQYEIGRLGTGSYLSDIFLLLIRIHSKIPLTPHKIWCVDHRSSPRSVAGASHSHRGRSRHAIQHVDGGAVAPQRHCEGYFYDLRT